VDLITEIYRSVHAIGMRIAEELEIAQPEALVLYFLAAKGVAPLEEIHRAFLHKRSTLTNVLFRLEERGLIERMTTSRDRRRFDIRLTKSGRPTAAEVSELFARIANSSGASPRDMSAAAEVLAKIAEGQEAPG
jgi:DNA-binding MarR family transcriptional regulator